MIYIISFDSTHHAMAAESAFAGLYSSRLVPLHPNISAGCGLALKAECENIDSLLAIIKENKLPYDKIYSNPEKGVFEVKA